MFIFIILKTIFGIKKILLISKDELLSFEGIQITMSNKLYNNIHKIIDNNYDAVVYSVGVDLKLKNILLAHF